MIVIWLFYYPSAISYYICSGLSRQLQYRSTVHIANRHPYRANRCISRKPRDQVRPASSSNLISHSPESYIFDDITDVLRRRRLLKQVDYSYCLTFCKTVASPVLCTGMVPVLVKMHPLFKTFSYGFICL